MLGNPDPLAKRPNRFATLFLLRDALPPQLTLLCLSGSHDSNMDRKRNSALLVFIGCLHRRVRGGHRNFGLHFLKEGIVR